MSAAAETVLAYVGTYTERSSHGIYVARFDLNTGQLSTLQLAAATTNPSFLAVHPEGRVLYAVNEIDDFRNERSGALSAFAIDAATGRLRLVAQESTRGATPCHLATDAAGHHLLVANYGGGSVAVLPIHGNGSIGPVSSLVRHAGRGPNPDRQEGPHAHMVAWDTRRDLVWVADLGIDRLVAYRLDAETHHLLEPPVVAVALAPGSGPRHFELARDSARLYVLEELSLAVTALRIDERHGTHVEPCQSHSTVIAPVSHSRELKAAGIQLDPSGRHLYASTRGTDTIAVFSIDPHEGHLTRIEVVSSGGTMPRAIALAPGGRWLLVANQGSDEVVVLGVDPTTGRLSPPSMRVPVSTPASIVFAR